MKWNYRNCSILNNHMYSYDQICYTKRNLPSSKMLFFNLEMIPFLYPNYEECVLHHYRTYGVVVYFSQLT